MGVDRVGFWSRINAWLRGDGRINGGHTSATLGNAPMSLSSETMQNSPGHGSSIYGEMPPGPGKGTGDTQNPPVSTEARLTDLVQSIQEHLQAQVQGSDVLVGSLDRLADGLERLPELAKAEAGALEKIAADVAAATSGVKRLELVLSQWPQLVDAQREAFVMLTRELERTRQTHDKMIASLEGLQQATGRSTATMDQTATALRELRAESTRREEKLDRTATELSSRLFWCAGVGVGVAALAVILAMIALFRS
jgi:uncharacterized phage infection (PIP) family protein YhgE